MESGRKEHGGPIKAAHLQRETAGPSEKDEGLRVRGLQPEAPGAVSELPKASPVAIVTRGFHEPPQHRILNCSFSQSA